MARVELIWTERTEAKIAEHGVSTDEVEQAMVAPTFEGTSTSSGFPLVMGFTDAGRRLVVIYERIDDFTVMPITAYEPGQ